MITRWMAAAVAVVITCSASGLAQDANSGNANGEIDGIAHVAYRVSNLDNELTFLKKLGYEESFAMKRGGQTTEVFVKVNDRQFIEVYPKTEPNQQLGWMHVCYESADLQGLHDALASKGLDPTRVQKAAAGNLIMSLKDPDGRTTEFTQYMPGSLHTLDRGKHLGSDRVSDTLLGFDLPVENLKAAQEFYDKLGFQVENADGSLRMSLPDNDKLRIEVRQYRPGSLAETLFTVYDAKNAEQALESTGLEVRRVKTLVFVRDPDGNPLVFLQSGQ
jgi:catechol 2,3-dioxygenase-like lactoylglutathione lyase family enzyme